jgi:Homeodomain-like domain
MTTAARRQRVAELRAEGLSFDRIGAALGCSKRTALLDANALGLSTAAVKRAMTTVDVGPQEPATPDRRVVEQLWSRHWRPMTKDLVDGWLRVDELKSKLHREHKPLTTTS